MLTVAVVEDDPIHADALVRHLRRWAHERRAPVRVHRLRDGADLLASYRPEVDLLLLDVEMPGVDGVTVAERVRERDEWVAVVFVTASAEHAVASYRVRALDYVVKPAGYLTVERVLDRVSAQVESRTERAVVLPSARGPLRLAESDIVSIAVTGRRVVVHGLDGPREVRGPLKEVEALLAGGPFFRCHHGFVVNLRHVVSVGDDACEVVTGQRVPVGRLRRTAFLGALTDYLAVAGR